MVYVLLDGRIGNNLFQVAAAASLAGRNNCGFRVITGRYKTPDSAQLVRYLQQFRTNILRKVEITEEMPEKYSLYQEREFSYQPVEYKAGILLDGFFQSEKYFDRNIVLDLFEVDMDTKNYIQQKYGDLFREEITALHVRRGDYLKSSDNYAVCSYPYFRNAIRHIGQNKRYLVFSDDIAWCKKKFIGDNFIFSEGETAIVDLYMQSFCTNNIISNSSFSWWGAWLNKNPGKIVIAPEPWFGVAYRDKNTKDLIPESWIRMKNRTPLMYRLYGYFLWWKHRIDYFVKSKILK